MFGSDSAATVRIRPARRRRPVPPKTCDELACHKLVLARATPFFEHPKLEGLNGLSRALPRKKPVLFATLAFAWLALSTAGCARGDVILGERGATMAPPVHQEAAGGASGAAQQAPHDAGALPTRTSTGAAAGSGGSAAPADALDASLPDEDARTPPPDSGPATSTPGSVARPSSGCGTVATASAVARNVTVDGMRADFLLDVPASYDASRAYPLVLAFRGMDQSAQQFRAQLDLAAVMGSEAIIVYANPIGDGTSWEFERDIPLIDVLLSSLGAAYCVDQDRTYALGASSGAMFVNLVGCVRADKVQAIAVLSSAPPPPGPCFDNTAVWLMQQNNTGPMTVGAGLGNRDFWATRNACNVLMPSSVTPAGCVEYASCRAGLPVRYCEHDSDDLPSFAVSAAWDFFRSL